MLIWNGQCTAGVSLSKVPNHQMVPEGPAMSWGTGLHLGQVCPDVCDEEQASQRHKTSFCLFDNENNKGKNA